MDIMINEDEPETSVDRYVMDTIADGAPDSDAFYVPPHWHKVRGLCTRSLSRFQCVGRTTAECL